MGRGGYDTSFDNTGTVAAHLHDHEQKEIAKEQEARLLEEAKNLRAIEKRRETQKMRCREKAKEKKAVKEAAKAMEDSFAAQVRKE